MKSTIVLLALTSTALTAPVPDPAADEKRQSFPGLGDSPFSSSSSGVGSAGSPLSSGLSSLGSSSGGSGSGSPLSGLGSSLGLSSRSDSAGSPLASGLSGLGSSGSSGSSPLSSLGGGSGSGSSGSPLSSLGGGSGSGSSGSPLSNLGSSLGSRSDSSPLSSLGGGSGSSGSGSSPLSSLGGGSGSGSDSSSPLSSLGSGLGSLSSRDGGSSSTENGVSQNKECQPLTFIFARGTSEMGNMGSVVGPPIAKQLSSLLGGKVTVQGVDYPADAAGNAEMGSSGGPKMASLVKQALQQCPDTKVVLGGYSQGSMVVHNAANSLSADENQVSAAVLFGDPFKTQSVGKLANDKRKEFCAQGDPVCANGANVMAHLSYGDQAKDAARFLVSASGVQGSSSSS